MRHAIPLLALLLGCPTKDDSGMAPPPGDSRDTNEADDTADPEDHCAEADAFIPLYDATIATWTTQDDAAPWPSSPLVFAGSSSVRRWEDFARTYHDRTPLQRGFGGAQLGEVAQRTHDLVTRHDPQAVILFAGTNDVEAGVDPTVVVERFRCFRQRVGQELGWDRPVLFVGITPTPARWDSWEQAAEVNAAVQAIAEDDAGVVYVDVPTAFLATGSPPQGDLFVGDQLHLSSAGYALWDSVLHPAVEAATAATAEGGGPTPDSGTRILVDLGPSNEDDGEHTASPDWLGQHWNNWHALEGGTGVLPGEHINALVDSTGTATEIDLVISGGFGANGTSNGGMIWPNPELLDDLAVGSATGDYFYTDGADSPGGLFLRGLDPTSSYTLRLFAARENLERRVTTFTVHGATTATADLQTSGSGAGHDGGPSNDDDVAQLSGLQPDAWGQLFVDVSIREGSYAYLSILELSVERALPRTVPHPAGVAVHPPLDAADPTDVGVLPHHRGHRRLHAQGVVDGAHPESLPHQ